jgi:hypothetical protein
MPDTWDILLDTLVLEPCEDFFGSTVTYTSKESGLTQVVTGIFDQQFLSLATMGSGPFPSQEALSIGAPGSITTRTPVLGVRLSQFVAPPAQGDTLSVQPALGDLLNYQVREVQPDGHGSAKLILKLLRPS